MPNFAYIARSRDGARRKGSIEAASKEEAQRRLKSEGLFLLQIRPSKRRHGSRVSQALVIQFLEDLGGLLNSGLTLDRALVVASANEKRQAFADVLRDIIATVRKGGHLSDALEKHQSVFGEMTAHLTRGGEWSGTVGDVLLRLARYKRRQQEFRSKLLASMLYPAMLFVLSTVTILVMLLYVLPEFGKIFEELNQDVPFVTDLLLKLGDAITKYKELLLVIFIALLALVAWARRSRRFKAWAQRTVLRLPYLKTLVIKKELSQFLRAMGTLLHGGIPILRSLKLASVMIANPYVREEIAGKLHHHLKGGGSMSRFLGKNPLFPPRASALLFIAEEQGKLAEGFLKLGDEYERELEQLVSRLMHLIEPVMIIGTGLVIGSAVFGMFMGVFSISDIDF